jgi:sugar phosphate permease
MFLLAIGTSLGGFLPITTVVVNWFERNRSMALGLVTGGVGLGGALAQFTAISIDTLGWRETTFASGIIILAIGLPASSLIRARPEDHGWELDGGPARERPGRRPRSGRALVRPERDYTLREALHTRQFWFIGLGHAASLLVVSAVSVHAIAHLRESMGFSIPRAQFILTIVVLSQSAGTLAGGWLGDRLNKQVIVVGCMFGHAAALILLANASATWMVFVFGVVHGICWGVRGPLMAAIRADYFGRSAFGLIFGASQALVVLGLIGGPLLAGVLYDTTGTYKAGFTILAMLAAAGSLFFVMSPPPKRSLPAGGA